MYSLSRVIRRRWWSCQTRRDGVDFKVTKGCPNVCETSVGVAFTSSSLKSLNGAPFGIKYDLKALELKEKRDGVAAYNVAGIINQQKKVKSTADSNFWKTYGRYASFEYVKLLAYVVGGCIMMTTGLDSFKDNFANCSPTGGRWVKLKEKRDAELAAKKLQAEELARQRKIEKFVEKHVIQPQMDNVTRSYLISYTAKINLNSKYQRSKNTFIIADKQEVLEELKKARFKSYPENKNLVWLDKKFDVVVVHYHTQDDVFKNVVYMENVYLLMKIQRMQGVNIPVHLDGIAAEPLVSSPHGKHDGIYTHKLVDGETLGDIVRLRRLERENEKIEKPASDPTIMSQPDSGGSGSGGTLSDKPNDEQPPSSSGFGRSVEDLSGNIGATSSTSSIPSTSTSKPSAYYPLKSEDYDEDEFDEDEFDEDEFDEDEFDDEYSGNFVTNSKAAESENKQVCSGSGEDTERGRLPQGLQKGDAIVAEGDEKGAKCSQNIIKTCRKEEETDTKESEVTETKESEVTKQEQPHQESKEQECRRNINKFLPQVEDAYAKLMQLKEDIEELAKLNEVFIEGMEEEKSNGLKHSQEELNSMKLHNDFRNKIPKAMNNVLQISNVYIQKYQSLLVSKSMTRNEIKSCFNMESYLNHMNDDKRNYERKIHKFWEAFKVVLRKEHDDIKDMIAESIEEWFCNEGKRQEELQKGMVFISEVVTYAEDKFKDDKAKLEEVAKVNQKVHELEKTAQEKLLKIAHGLCDGRRQVEEMNAFHGDKDDNSGIKSRIEDFYKFCEDGLITRTKINESIDEFDNTIKKIKKVAKTLIDMLE